MYHHQFISFTNRHMQEIGNLVLFVWDCMCVNFLLFIIFPSFKQNKGLNTHITTGQYFGRRIKRYCNATRNILCRGKLFVIFITCLINCNTEMHQNKCITSTSVQLSFQAIWCFPSIYSGFFHVSSKHAHYMGK